MKFLNKLIFPRFLAMGIMGWDDILLLLASSAITAGANSAANSGAESRSTGFGSIPTMDTSQQDQMSSMLQQLAQTRQSKGGMM